MATINTELFMIFSNMLHKWASVVSLTKATKRVGVIPLHTATTSHLEAK
jgi:hypothetical protein